MAAIDVSRSQQAFNSAAKGKVAPDEKFSLTETVTGYSEPAPNPYQQQIQQQMDRYSGGLPQLDNSTYFPGAGADIRKGGYSGPTIGSTSSYAPNQLVPFGIWGARNEQNAMKDAAVKKSTADFFKNAAPPETTRFSVQEELDQKYYDGLNQWLPVLQQRYGSNWAEAAAQDTQFQQWNTNMATTAKYNTGMMENSARIAALQDDPEFVVSKATLDADRRMVAGVGGLYEPTPFGTASNTNVPESLLAANAEIELDVAVNEALTKFVNDPSSSVYKAGGGGIYDSWVTLKKIGMTEDQLESMSTSIWNDRYGGQSGMYSKEIIKDRLRTLYPIKAEKSIEFEKNRFESSDGTYETYSDGDIVHGTKINATLNKGKWMLNGVVVPQATPGAKFKADKGATELNSSTSAAGVTLRKAVKQTVAQGTSMYNLSTGSMVSATGSEEFVVGEVQVLPVTNTGVVITDKNMEGYYKLHPEQWSYQPMAIGSYTPIEEQKNTTTGGTSLVAREPVTVAKPANELSLERRNSQGAYESGVPVTKLQDKADKLNAEKNAAPKPAGGGGNTSNARGVDAPYYTNPTEEQYNSLPPGAKYMYNGVEETKQ